MIPMTGDRFGPYEILGTLGRGGVGEVYRAWDVRLERDVALKLLHDDYPQAGNRERFSIEARAASALNHANICTVFDIGEKDGWPYLVMELLKGITLKQRIERSPLGAEEIVRIALEIAAALGAAHALGIIHRDIKPANVMLMRQSDGRTRAKVLDFGLAKLTGPLPGRLTHDDDHLTVVGEAVGTVSYMSPEQARGDALDGRSDLFSLGVVMYEMATRRTPFHGATTALLFARLLGRDPEPIRQWNDSIPRGLEKIIFRLLEKDPGRRFQTAAETVSALEQVLARLTSGRWRRGSSPAVPLVRVEEPVARPELPVLPDFVREQTRSSESGSSRAAATETGPERGRPSRIRNTGAHVSRPGFGQEPVAASAGVSSSSFSAWPFVRTETASAPRPHWWRRMWLPGSVAAAVLCVAGALFTVRAAGSHGVALGPADTLMITAVENHTGVQTLDGSIAEGLELDLAQTPALNIRDVGEFRTVLHSLGADAQPVSPALARQAAQAAGARAFVYGELREGEQGAHGSGAGFSLHVAVLETAGTRELASADARAGRTEEIPNAIDEITHRLVQQLTPNSGDNGRRPVPLAREATGSLNALHAYSVAVAAQAAGRRTVALRWFSTAAATDPGFVQAQMDCAWLAHEANAEVAAQQAALHALDASQDRSARTVLLAETAGELIGLNNPERALAAAKTLIEQNPHDEGARLAGVRAQRAAGEYRQAERSAQQGIAAGERSSDLFREAELALITLNRYDDALSLEARAVHSSSAHPEIALEAAYLAGREDRIASSLAELDKSPEEAALFAPVRATYYDNTGQLPEGESAWADAARALRSQPAMAGAAEWMLARAALNRAFAGECGVAMQFAGAAVSGSTGEQARSDAAVAGVLCNHAEQTAQPNPDLAARAAAALVSGDPAWAASAVSALPQDGADPVILYLRGMAHLQAGSAAAAAQDFRELLTRRGAIFLGGTDLYPMAHFKLARAYGEAGERTRSTDSYRQFIALWDGASSADRLRSEAMAGVHGAPAPAQREIQRQPVEVAAVRHASRHRRLMRADPFPTPAWLRPSEPQKPESAAVASPRRSDAPGYPEERKFPEDGRGTDLE